MADFKTHMLGAALVTGVVATGMAMVSASAGDQAVLGYFALGVIGGILPDVDSDSSIPIRVAFNVLSVVAAFLVVFQFGGHFSLLELVILGGGAFVLVRYGVFSIFTKFTVHRGLFHSLPAAAFAGLLTVILAAQVFATPPLQAWTSGAFVVVGFLVHLILDELYSVDLMGMKIKRSFGTAFNLGDMNNLIGTGALYLAVVGLFYLCPPPTAILAAISNREAYQELGGRLIPTGMWFKGLLADIL